MLIHCAMITADSALSVTFNDSRTEGEGKESFCSKETGGQWESGKGGSNSSGNSN